MENRTYIAIDLKSFYASVECRERGLDPLDTNLVVADPTRTDKTICLAVSPSMKKRGIPGRPRLFEVVQKVSVINAQRLRLAGGDGFTGKSYSESELEKDPSLELDYIIAQPRMATYMEYSTRIYKIYLKYASPEDIHIYSIDEVFIDATDYMRTTGMDARAFTMKIIHDVLSATGITATAGIGTNLYLAKIAMDIEAKHISADKDGVRIAELDEMSYRKRLWDHQPITDFWRVGGGIAKKLEENGIFTMGDIARCSLGSTAQYHNEELLYKLFGINAQLLIDHAWGYEPCRMCDIKGYKSENKSICSGQVLQEPYTHEKGRIIVREMTELLVLDIFEKGLVTDQIVLTVGYDTENLTDPERARNYKGNVKLDHYGRRVPKHGGGIANLKCPTSSLSIIMDAAMELYENSVDSALLIRRVNITANRLTEGSDVVGEPEEEQLDLFGDPEEPEKSREAEMDGLEREKRRQQAILDIKKKYGKNAILKAISLEEGATMMERNRQIGGHKA